MSLLELPIKRRNEGTMLSQKLNGKKKCTVSTMSQVTMLMPVVGKDARNFASAVNE